MGAIYREHGPTVLMPKYRPLGNRNGIGAFLGDHANIHTGAGPQTRFAVVEFDDGAYALLLQWLMRWRIIAAATRLRRELPATLSNDVLPNHVMSGLSQGQGTHMIEEGKVMTPDEAREWLNRLLVKQLKK